MADLLDLLLNTHATYVAEVDPERTDRSFVFWRYRCACGDLLDRGGLASDRHREHLARLLRRMVQERADTAFLVGCAYGRDAERARVVRGSSCVGD